MVAVRRRGRPRRDDKQMLNGILWVICSGALWRDMPEDFGPWSSVYQRFRDWRNQRVFDQMLKRLQLKRNESGQIDLKTWMIDSTYWRHSTTFRAFIRYNSRLHLYGAVKRGPFMP